MVTTKIQPKKSTKLRSSVKTKPKTTTVFKKRSVQVFSRHPSHSPLRRSIFIPGVRACIRFGSHTEGNVKYDVEINKAKNIDNSANKLLMKRMFTAANVKTAAWVDPAKHSSREALIKECEALGYPIIAKHIFGSKNRGNYKLDSKEALENWLKGKTLENYIFEKFHNYNREYRLHVTTSGYFYACRKMLRNETPDDKRWYRNDENSVWITEFEPVRDSTNTIIGESTKDNVSFDRPVNFKTIAEECVKAVKAVGLDFGACDVRVQSSKTEKGKTRENPEFIIIEINSAPGLGTLGVIKYKEMIPELIKSKLNAR